MVHAGADARGAYLAVMQTTTDSHEDVRSQLGAEHDELAKRFLDLGNASEQGDRATVLASFRALDAALRAHMAHEEEALLPALAARHPDEVGAIARENAELRARLDELAIQAELHALRDETVRAFVDHLEAHAQREDAGLYHFAESELAASVKRGALASALDRLAALAGRLYAT
jgi:hemerythrin-like domain-containing protein